MKRNGGLPMGLITVFIAALFLAGFLLPVTFGADTYRDAAISQAENNERRAILSYLSACVRGSDTAGGVYVQEDEAGPVLIIAGGSDYALHIYQRDGQLLEEYSAIDAPLNPQGATVLGKTEIFRVTSPVEGTLRIDTDAGHALLHLRSGEGRNAQ